MAVNPFHPVLNIKRNPSEGIHVVWREINKNSSYIETRKIARRSGEQLKISQ